MTKTQHFLTDISSLFDRKLVNFLLLLLEGDKKTFLLVQNIFSINKNGFLIPPQKTKTIKWRVYVRNHVSYFCDKLRELAFWSTIGKFKKKKNVRTSFLDFLEKIWKINEWNMSSGSLCVKIAFTLKWNAPAILLTYKLKVL